MDCILEDGTNVGKTGASATKSSVDGSAGGETSSQGGWHYFFLILIIQKLHKTFSGYSSARRRSTEGRRSIGASNPPPMPTRPHAVATGSGRRGSSALDKQMGPSSSVSEAGVATISVVGKSDSERSFSYWMMVTITPEVHFYNF